MSNLTTIETTFEPLIQAVLKDRLFGRKHQAIALREAYQRICCALPGASRQAELVLLTGVSGTGKTTLADNLKRFVVSNDGCRGVFIKGKYDRLHRENQTPSAGFVAAFADYASQMTDEGSSVVQTIRDLVLANKDVDTKLLVNMVPSLEELLGESPDEFSSTSDTGKGTYILSDSMRHRFRLTFSEFVGTLSAYRPIVLFLDDLQWCDMDSLELLDALAMQAHPGFMILGACRHNEVAVRDPLSECLRMVEESGVVITNIFLKCLDAPMVRELLSVSLRLPKEECDELASVVYRQTKGNFFYLTNFTNALQLDNILYYDDEEERWKWDGGRLQVLDVSSVELLRKMMLRLPENVQAVLKTAASVGARFSITVIGLLLPSINVKSALQTASLVEFVVNDGAAGMYSFSHDQIQEAAYTLILEEEQTSFHWKQCRKLWRSTKSLEDPSYRSLVVGQITKCVSEIKSGADRDKAARFLLKAGRKASSSSAFDTALAYLQLGIDLLGEKRWEEHYELCLSTHNFAAEVSYGVGDSAHLDNIVNSVFLHAKDYEDKIPAYLVKILSLGTAFRLGEAIELGFEVLRNVGEPFSKPSKAQAVVEVWQVQRTLRKLSSRDVLDLPLMTDPKKLVAMRVISLLYLYAFCGQPEYALPFAARLVTLTLRHGLSEMSSAGFSFFSIIRASKHPLIKSDLDEAYLLSKLSLDILDKFSSTKKHWLPRVYAAVYGNVFPWREPMPNCRDRLWEAFLVGMRTGDIEFGMICGTLYVTNGVLWGKPLHAMKQEIAELQKTAKAYGVDLVDTFLSPIQQLVANLVGECEDVFTLTGEFMDEEKKRQAMSHSRNFSGWLNILIFKSWLAVYMGNWELAELIHQEIVGVDEAFRSSLALAGYHFQAAMIAIALLRKYGRNRTRYTTFHRSFREIKKMARNCPTNFCALQTILEAEQSAFLRKIDDSVTRYNLAVDVSKRERILCYEGIALDRLACTVEGDRQRSNEARGHFTKARSVFEAWGANVKVDQLNEIIGDHEHEDHPGY